MSEKIGPKRPEENSPSLAAKSGARGIQSRTAGKKKTATTAPAPQSSKSASTTGSMLESEKLLRLENFWDLQSISYGDSFNDQSIVKLD